MRIDLIAPPYSGHLHPILAMALELAPTHRVRVLSTPAGAAEAAACGLPARALLDADADRELRRISDPRHAVGSHPVRMLRQLRAALAVMARLRDALEATYAHARPGLVIADFTVPVAGAVASRLGVPWWTSLPSPCVIETPDGPPAYLGGLRPADGPLSHARDAAARALVRAFKRTLHRSHRARMRALGFPALYRADGSEAAYSPQRILALGLPSLEFPRRWPDAVRFVGPRLPPAGRRTPWLPERPAPRFRAGRRHVLVTLGTHLGWAKDALDRRLRDLAAAMPDVEIHFSDGDAQAQHHGQAGNYQRLAYVDYAQWLGRYDLVVHHGGAGIMYQCIATARPAIVMPQDYDQFDHAARLDAAGAAIRLRRADGLGEAIRGALDAPDRFRALPALQAELQRLLAANPLAGMVDAAFARGE